MTELGAPTRAEVCAVAVAECFRGDGEILANPIGTIPMIGGRLARATFEPDLAMTDGEAKLIANDEATPAPDALVIEHFNPYRHMFDWVWSGKRHVMMGATQVDRYGNQNIAAIGDYAQAPHAAARLPRRARQHHQRRHVVLGAEPRARRWSCAQVDTVCGIGYDRAAELGPEAARFHEIRRVVTNLCVLDFETPDHRMRLRSVHPGVTVDEVVAATGFELVVPDDVRRVPPADRRRARLLREVIDPDATREREVPNP